MLTVKEVKRGLRAPTIIVRDTFAQNCFFCDSGRIWVTVLFQKLRRIFVSLHLPHSKLSFDFFSTTLHDVRQQLILFPGHKFFVGVDANVKVAGLLGWIFDR